MLSTQRVVPPEPEELQLAEVGSTQAMAGQAVTQGRAVAASMYLLKFAIVAVRAALTKVSQPQVRLDLTLTVHRSTVEPVPHCLATASSVRYAEAS